MYIIYEIKGKKIGCTREDQWEIRQKAQRKVGKMTILETHTDIDIASKREIELQNKRGYTTKEKWDYKHSVNNAKTVCRTPEAIKKRVSNTDYKRLGKLCSIRQKGKPLHPNARTPEATAKRVAKLKAKGFVPKPFLRKKIKMFKDGIFIREYTGLWTCAKDMNWTNIYGISSSLRGTGRGYKGYTFKYA